MPRPLTIEEAGSILLSILSAESFLTLDAQKRMKNDIFEHNIEYLVMAMPRQAHEHSQYLFNRYENI